jgi:ABC-type Fe3+ transport system permease subunit
MRAAVRTRLRVPCAILLRLAATGGDAEFGARFLHLARNSFVLATLTAVIACVLALALSYARRIDPRRRRAPRIGSPAWVTRSRDRSSRSAC